MKQPGSNGARPDIDAAIRSGFSSQRTDGEGASVLSTLEQAIYWRHICADIVEMQERVLDRIPVQMAKESMEIQMEVELTNVRAIVAQVGRWRQRLGYWDSRIAELGARDPSK